MSDQRLILKDWEDYKAKSVDKFLKDMPIPSPVAKEFSEWVEHIFYRGAVSVLMHYIKAPDPRTLTSDLTKELVFYMLDDLKKSADKEAKMEKGFV
jgi:hypothetical protein